jgi:hypothetical protein
MPTPSRSPLGNLWPLPACWSASAVSTSFDDWSASRWTCWILKSRSVERSPQPIRSYGSRPRTRRRWPTGCRQRWGNGTAHWNWLLRFQQGLPTPRPDRPVPKARRNSPMLGPRCGSDCRKVWNWSQLPMPITSGHAARYRKRFCKPPPRLGSGLGWWIRSTKPPDVTRSHGSAVIACETSNDWPSEPALAGY